MGHRLLYKGRRALPEESCHIHELLLAFAVVGHNRKYKTYLRLAVDWFWGVTRKTMTKFFRECLVCKQQKVSHLQWGGLLRAFPIPSLVREDVSMDFLEGLIKSGGFEQSNVILNVTTILGVPNFTLPFCWEDTL